MVIHSSQSGVCVFSPLELTDRLIDLNESRNYTVSILNWLQVIKMLLNQSEIAAWFIRGN